VPAERYFERLKQQRPCPFELNLQLGDTPIARDNVFLQLLQLALKQARQ
jgi:hypothetical protein